MTDEQMAKVPGGVQLLPMTGGRDRDRLQPAGRPEGAEAARVTSTPAIFLGKITKWSDPKLKAANPGVTLPDLDITVVRRADSSGTTFVFTTHLAAISEEWKKGPGAGTTVNWPKSDKFVASPKNDGVTATIKQTPGAIGYIEYAFAKFAKVEMAQLQNRAGQFVGPGGEGGPAALASVQLPANLRAWISDPEGAKAYPIATYTWMLFYKENKDPKKAAALRQLVEYCLTRGTEGRARQMGYIPLPGHRGRGGAESLGEHPVDLLRMERRSRARSRSTGVQPGTVSGPPTTWDYFADRAFRGLAQAGVWLILLLLAFILWSIGGKAWVAMRDHGLGFLTSTTWDVGRQQFGVLPQIWGTLYSSLLALLIGGFFGVVHGDLPDPGFPAAAAGPGVPHHRRAARRHPERGLRALGALRRRPRHAAGRELALRAPRLDPVLRHAR